MDPNHEKLSNDLPDVLILCGGQGTRLRPAVSDNPKPLAAIGNRVFLDILLQQIFDQGFSRVILAVGYMKDKIIERYSGDPRLLFSVEESPLGTGGALMKAMDLLETEDFIVMNGDSYCNADLRKVYKEHAKREPIISMVLTESDDVSDSGSVSVDESSRVLDFKEKTSGKRKGLVNAGIYIFNKKIKAHMPKQVNFSLERDLFPSIIPRQFCYGHIVPGGVFDIGTPERYNIAKQKFTNSW